ncbi:MAG TPA: DUF1592 domain-containing protein [Methylomirabilota bacterium]|nr:DUF1592 domain-containing protein [Methylomirabilota bacterium]
MREHCLDCHDRTSKKGDFDLESLLPDAITAHPDSWEKVLRKLRTRQMPPAGKRRPAEKAYEEVVARLASSLDRAAARNPNPGRTETFRRLNRSEYRNAIRDLLALDIDAAALLPKDESSHGFDNVTGGDLSPTLLNRYVAAAEKISRLAIGVPHRAPGGETYRLPPDLTQEDHVEGLPLGTRGGALLRHTFPQDGEYEIQIRLTRDRNEEVEGLHEPHELVVLLDRAQVKSFTVAPPGDRNFDQVDAHLKARIPVTAGPHQVGVTFVKNPSSLLETRREPYRARFNMHRHPRLGPAVYQVSINGPYNSTGPGDTPSRRRIFVCYPASPSGNERGSGASIRGEDQSRHPTTAPGVAKAGAEASDAEPCAEQILATLMRRAYRRPVTPDDLARPMQFYRDVSALEGFEAGIEAALAAVLVSPEFLFRIERDPPGIAPGTVYRISDLELASRLSFFLWGSIPDDELLAVAERGQLHKPRVLEKQVRRMLADERALNLVRNFGEQWLHLRNLESITPDLRLFPDFDDNLRQAFRRETELHLETVLREDRNVLDLLKTDYTFLNERLAKHYGVPHVQGSRFRRVALGRDSARGGLLRQGSILTVTSYATRTSPVLRGKWILENIIGTPPPPPLPDVPALDNVVAANLSVRERLAQHRAHAACAGCHNLIDPPGFALENFDAVGRWRTLEAGKPVDASGGLPDGSRFDGVAGLEDSLLRHPEWFAFALTEKLLTFALGRGVEPYDAPAVRKIVREAAKEDYRLSSIIVGLAKSTPFTRRKSP